MLLPYTRVWVGDYSELVTPAVTFARGSLSGDGHSGSPGGSGQTVGGTQAKPGG